MSKDLRNIIKILQAMPAIKLAYLFGSRARKQSGPLSDYDFAFYVDKTLTKKQMFELKLALQNKLSQILKTDRVDVIILNIVDGPELKYMVIKDGKLIYEQEPYRVVVEPRIYDEYFDFQELLRRYHLTRA